MQSLGSSNGISHGWLSIIAKSIGLSYLQLTEIDSQVFEKIFHVIASAVDIHI